MSMYYVRRIAYIPQVVWIFLITRFSDSLVTQPVSFEIFQTTEELAFMCQKIEMNDHPVNTGVEFGQHADPSG